MFRSWFRVLLARKSQSHSRFSFFLRTQLNSSHVKPSLTGSLSNRGSSLHCDFVLGAGASRGFCAVVANRNLENSHVEIDKDKKFKILYEKPIDFTKVDINLLPTVMIIGRPNVGKSALFNRLIRRREALVYNTPDDHVTRDIREGIAKLCDLRFRVLDSAGLETEATSGSILDRTAGMTAKVLAKTQFAIFLIDVRLVLLMSLCVLYEVLLFEFIFSNAHSNKFRTVKS
ncbi:hypothetical protein Patl1_36658 [Pistacia atlantica]|nr:hypothetical protein Patl1_36658 [Pistacia atlantica]